VPPAAKVVVVVSLDGPEAIASYDPDAFANAFASASGVSKDDMEVVTSVKQDMTLGGVTELSDDAQVVLVNSTAGAMRVDPKAVSLSGMTSSTPKIRQKLGCEQQFDIVDADCRAQRCISIGRGGICGKRPMRRYVQA
jgi:hypothetical protein